MTRVYVVIREGRDYADGWITTVEKVFTLFDDAKKYCRENNSRDFKGYYDWHGVDLE